MPAVHYKYQYSTYYAPCASTACFTSCVTATLTIVVTLLFVWNTRNLWVLQGQFFEQPKVQFQDEFLFEFDTPSSTLTYTNIAAVQAQLAPSRLRAGAFAFESTDTNNDNRPDEFRFTVSLPVSDLGGVVSFRGVLLFDFLLDARFRMYTPAMAVLQGGAAIPGGAATFVGDLVYGTPRILIRDRDTVVVSEAPLDEAAYAAAGGDFATLVRDYQLRNISVLYQHQPPTWSRYSGSTFTVDATVRLPRQLIAYRPGFWESIKFAWIQIAAVLVIPFLVRGCVHECIFENRLVATRFVPAPGGKPHSF